MPLACPAFNVWWSSILLSTLELPFLERRFVVADIRNVTCEKIEIGSGAVVANSSTWRLGIRQPINVACSSIVGIGVATFNVSLDLTVDPSEISFETGSDEQCWITRHFSEACSVNAKINTLSAVPRDSFMDKVLDVVRRVVNGNLGSLVCGVGLSSFEDALLNNTVIPPKPLPAPVNGFTPVGSAAVVQGLLTAVQNMSPVTGFQLNASVESNTTLNFKARLIQDVNYTFGPIEQQGTTMQSVLKVLNILSATLIPGSYVDKMLKRGRIFFNGSLAANLPKNLSVSVDVSLIDLRCDESNRSCTLPCKGDIAVQNIRSQGKGEWSTLFTNYVGPLTAPFANEILSAVTLPLCSEGEERFILPEWAPDAQNIPPVALCIGGAVGAVIILVFGIILTAYRSRRTMVEASAESVPVVPHVTITEQSALLFLTVASALCLLWSNSTTMAALAVGGTSNFVVFSLVETAKLFWKSSHLIAVLTTYVTVHPYLVLFCILVHLLILQRSSRLLRMVCHSTKISFVYVFALVIMGTGLEVAGVVSLKIFPGMYVFILAIILTNLTAHYALCLWDREATISKPPELQSYEPTFDESAFSNEQEAVDESKDDKPAERCSFVKMLLRMLNGMFVCACLVMMWVVACLHFEVGGVSTLILPKGRLMSMMDLTADSMILRVVFMILAVVFPVTHALLFPKWTTTVLWCAADILLLACLSALLGLEWFVELIIGPNAKLMYNARVMFLKPMYLLFVAVFWHWSLALGHALHHARWKNGGSVSKTSRPPSPSTSED
ncbi:hypothetical protein ERJ75_000243600 [Trypanosoma vivax]|nr:hypothetical protein ERJ75_000243600 [Trypanosoma vivax]